jgi:hypothetical protein
MGMYPRGMREGMSSWSFSIVSDRHTYFESELIAGVTEYAYKPTLPTRFPTRNILTTPTIRCSLSAFNLIESIRDSKEGSTGKRRSLEFKSSKTGESPPIPHLVIMG